MSGGFKHEAPIGASVEWYTPPEVFSALGITFDLDPASPPGGLPWVPAARHLSAADDGLTAPWRGRVWLNPPYARDVERWLTRLADHGDGIALVFNRSDTQWWQNVVPRASAVCFVERRLRFIRADGQRGGSAGAPSILLAFGTVCAIAVAQSGLGYTAPILQASARRAA